MELIKLMCSKIMQDKIIPNFSWSHERAILCFYKHKKLELYKISMIIDESKYKTQKILQDLIEMQIIKQQNKEFIMYNVFDALNNLIISADGALYEHGTKRCRARIQRDRASSHRDVARLRICVLDH